MMTLTQLQKGCIMVIVSKLFYFYLKKGESHGY
jgi:hypothetical protein